MHIELSCFPLQKDDSTHYKGEEGMSIILIEEKKQSHS